MAIEVDDVLPAGPNEAIVLVTSESKGETISYKAKEAAIMAGQQVIGRCGFSSYEEWSYRNPPDAAHPEGEVLDEQALATPGRLKVGGKYIQRIKVRARV